MKDSEFLMEILDEAKDMSYWSMGRLVRLGEIISRLKDVEMSVAGFPKS